MSHDLLYQLEGSLHRLPDDVQAWLKTALDTYLKTPELTLDDCLGLSRMGRTTYAKLKRDYYLKQAASHEPDLKRLAQSIKQFERHVWPALGKLDRPHEVASEVYKALFHARKAYDRPLPRSSKHLERIIGTSST